MRLVSSDLVKRVLKRPAVGVFVGVGVLSASLITVGYADPAQDALAKLNELSRQAEQVSEAVNAAQIDLTTKLAEQTAAEQQHVGDQAALESARTRLGNYQTSVDDFAVASYMGGRTDDMNAVLVATSPQNLIDRLSVQHAIGTYMTQTMTDFRAAREETTKAEAASAKSAADAKTAAEQAATVRAGLMAKQSDLQLKIAVVRSQYNLLTPQQRVALADPGPVPAPPAPPGPDILAAPPAPGLPPEAQPPADPGPGAPGDLPPGDVAPMPGGNPVGSTVVQAALSRIGSPYSWGGSGPGAFDCSGLVMWAYQQAGIGLPHSSYALAAGGQAVSRDQLQPGDVVNHYSDASHTSIYIGDGMVVHASTYGVPVRVVPLDAAGPFYNARRY
ncbi:peptidoglycan hydrolase RipC [Mycolicibacterium fallax]|uniref:Endopeptidase n=1 Tax=Mycolicibacterium fallax TaxID=1793 RepID=A0A1X1R521_MYCFA|nr:peptidoglycan hydrolase RipC [Mycolicibacterium fallax]ORU99291.1 endopeptidase [Mycolicibacterium fallax]BBY97797.1 endopeptidase [Mycolicibacterium fallax]HOW93637.1 peptidoglycan hydrolase RipC [Mycolicibacterium fallax]